MSEELKVGDKAWIVDDKHEAIQVEIVNLDEHPSGHFFEAKGVDEPTFETGDYVWTLYPTEREALSRIVDKFAMRISQSVLSIDATEKILTADREKLVEDARRLSEMRLRIARLKREPQ